MHALITSKYISKKGLVQNIDYKIKLFNEFNS